MANDLNRSIKIYIDGMEAQDSINKIEASIQKLKDKLASLNTEEKNYAQKSKEIEDEIRKKTATQER